VLRGVRHVPVPTTINSHRLSNDRIRCYVQFATCRDSSASRFFLRRVQQAPQPHCSAAARVLFEPSFALAHDVLFAPRRPSILPRYIQLSAL
jgi:hypothetical protein